MKKLILNLTLLLLGIGQGAWAQVFPEASTQANPKWYTIESYNRGGYLTDMGAGQSLQHVDKAIGSYWRFEDAGDGAMYMYSYVGKWREHRGHKHIGW